MKISQAQLRKFHATWNEAGKFLSKTMNKAEIEEEKQEILRLAGVMPDKAGRYSSKRLTGSKLSTVLDLIETTILGKPNQKRRTEGLVFQIKNLGLDSAYLDAICRDRFSADNWQEIGADNLQKLFYTAKTRARQMATI